ncbi:hypothetical protein NPIL_452211, partial [Nephila pilipes]
MPFLSRARKVDLITLAEELGLTVEPNAKISDLLRLITNDKNYDDDFTKDCLEVISNERKEEEQRRDEHEKREWEYELKKLELESKATLSDGNVPITVPKLNLMKLMPPKAINLDEVDLSHITDQDIKHNLKQVLDTYTPQKRKTTDVMMKIVLTDESPIHSKPRRLAANEKTFVDSQIQHWLDAGIIKES